MMPLDKEILAGMDTYPKIHEEEAHTVDPGDGRWGIVPQLILRVIILKHAGA
jgi:hypothetical protein